MVNRNGKFVVEQSFAVPFDHVAEGGNAEGVKPLPYGRWFTEMVILLYGTDLRRFIRHVAEGGNAEGVKPLPYGRWFTEMVILLCETVFCRSVWRCYGKGQCGRGQAPSLRKIVSCSRKGESDFGTNGFQK